VDDILDVTGSDEELGKPSGSDERHGKLTYVSAYGLDRARELASESHRKAREALAEAAAQTDDLARITDFIHTRHTSWPRIPSATNPRACSIRSRAPPTSRSSPTMSSSGSRRRCAS